MKAFLTWTGISMAAVAGVMLAARWASRVSAKVDEGLGHIERVTKDTREAVEKTADALASTESAVHAARRTVS